MELEDSLRLRAASEQEARTHEHLVSSLQSMLFWLFATIVVTRRREIASCMETLLHGVSHLQAWGGGAPPPPIFEK